MCRQVNITLGGAPGPVSGTYSFDQNPLPLRPVTVTVTYRYRQRAISTNNFDQNSRKSNKKKFHLTKQHTFSLSPYLSHISFVFHSSNCLMEFRLNKAQTTLILVFLHLLVSENNMHQTWKHQYILIMYLPCSHKTPNMFSSLKCIISNKCKTSNKSAVGTTK